MIPLRIHNQEIPDECTACAIAAISEKYLGKYVDDRFIYNNEEDGNFGVTPKKAINSVVSNGIRLLETDQIVKIFTGANKIWGLGILFFPDMFDGLIKNLKSGPIFCGSYWQTGWDASPGGILFVPSQWQKVAPHAFAVIDSKVIGGETYIQIQNSRGISIGDNGTFWAKREIVNHFLFAYQFQLNASSVS